MIQFGLGTEATFYTKLSATFSSAVALVVVTSSLVGRSRFVYALATVLVLILSLSSLSRSSLSLPDLDSIVSATGRSSGGDLGPWGGDLGRVQTLPGLPP